jgi:O-antigen ligase
MPPDGSPDIFVDGSRASHRTSAAMTAVVIAAIFANCLLLSPSRFSDQQAQDRSPLHYVVYVLGLGAAFPTARGVEIRNLIFTLGAAALSLLAAWRLIGGRLRPRIAVDDLLEIRDRAKGPYFWWILLLAASIVSSMSSHAPEVCNGQTIVRFIQAAWWWPLALMLAPVHVPVLAAGLLTALSVMSAYGLWYHLARVVTAVPDARLQFPIGNELWLAACLLPAIFIPFGLMRYYSATHDATVILPQQRQYHEPRSNYFLIIALVPVLAALYYTRSRSALAGLAAGVVMCILMLLPAKPRKVTLLVTLILAIGAVGYVQRLRESGTVASRAISVRARLNYEWPYALTLFLQKPVGGHGDGAYSLLAGGFAREDQLEDPRVLAMEGHSWPGHPHNEFLELLSDLGAAGVLGFTLALMVTLFRAMQAADKLRGNPELAASRRLIIALAGALAALIVEEFSSVALREPGFPPIFFTVWAALWALVRPLRDVPPPLSDQRLFPGATFKLAGVTLALGAGTLAWYGMNDWRGALAYQRSFSDTNKEAAIASADFAARHVLDPFRNVSAKKRAVDARLDHFSSLLSDRDRPSNDTIELGRDALLRLTQLNATAPRFLGASSCEWQLALTLEGALTRRGDAKEAQAAHARFIRALEQCRADEPFQSEIVQRLCDARPEAPATDKLLWLRAFLRGGEADGYFDVAFQSLAAQPDTISVLSGLLDVARRDATRQSDNWSDILSPETLRLSAMATSSRRAQAIKYLEQADAMYTRAGPRLYAAHAAAVHELVKNRFALDPMANVDKNLADLARADELIEGSSSPDKPLPAPKGWTRLLILLVAEKDTAMRQQLTALPEDFLASESHRLNFAYESLAKMFTQSHPNLAQKWREKAKQLSATP